MCIEDGRWRATEETSRGKREGYLHFCSFHAKAKPEELVAPMCNVNNVECARRRMTQVYVVLGRKKAVLLWDYTEIPLVLSITWLFRVDHRRGVKLEGNGRGTENWYDEKITLVTGLRGTFDRSYSGPVENTLNLSMKYVNSIYFSRVSWV